jgi:regulator of nucleoside diphosphate kinase
MKNQIHITKPDYLKLTAIVDNFGPANKELMQWLALLEHELDRANIVDSHEIPEGIITLYSRVRLRDLDSGELLTCKLVLPSEAGRTEDGLSVLAPVGIAMLGYGEGDSFECTTPGGTRAFRVESVLFQPEAEANRRRSFVGPLPAQVGAGAPSDRM